jgi:hypothetical protein
LNKQIPNVFLPKESLLRAKLRTCDYEFLPVYCHSFTNRVRIDKQISREFDEVCDAWQLVNNQGKIDISIQLQGLAAIEHLTESLPSYNGRPLNPLLRRFRDDICEKRFLVLLTQHIEQDLPRYELNYLCNLWQIKYQLKIPLHVSGVIHKNLLFLFGGPSGVGKSTVAGLSTKRGDMVIDEDQLLLQRQPDGNYRAQAWGYSLQSYDTPLSAVFKLVQDNQDCLTPLSQLQTTRFLLERVMDVIGSKLPQGSMEQIFHQAAEMARFIPGYELHFRKSPDFWKLIDEQVLNESQSYPA